MAIRNIVEIWAEDGVIKENIDFLTRKTKPVCLPLSETDRNIIQDLKDTFGNIPAAGIAANQIGHDRSIFIGYNPSYDSPDKDYEIFINPKILKADPHSTQAGTEGCLSIPGLTVSVTRYDMIDVEYVNIEGELVELTLDNYISRLFQHELDHLMGRFTLHRNPTGFVATGELLSEIDIKKLFENVDKQINENVEKICPFLQTERMWPIIGIKEYKCSAQIGSLDCSKNKDRYCITIDHTECEHFDERLIL